MDVREKLVKLIENGVPCPDGRDPFGEYCDTCRYSESADCSNERLADYLISHGVTVQEWISVKDRLPENGVHVLLCCEIHRYDGEIAGKYVCDGYYAEANKLIAGEYEYSEEDDEYYLREGWYEVIKNWDAYTSVPVEDFVTHWMPLPEPLKGE